MPKKTSGLENLIFVTQIGINMTAPILVGVYLGKKLDEYFNKAPLFLFIFIIMGIIAAFTNLFKLIGKVLGDKKRK